MHRIATVTVFSEPGVWPVGMDHPLATAQPPSHADVGEAVIFSVIGLGTVGGWR